MPIGRKFLDSTGSRGRAYIAPKKEVIVTGRLAKSYDKALTSESKQLRIYRNTQGYNIDFTKVVGRSLRIKVKDMKALANWILEEAE